MAEGEVPSWGDPDVTDQFETAGFTDPGESAALASVGTRAQGQVLDIGIGGGRTTDLLAAEAAGYLGVDLAPEMIAVARRRFPDADLRVCNALDIASLAGLPAPGFDLVMWSYNGLDALGHADRGRALRAMAALTAPTGRVLFSSLNLDGISYDEHPWSVPQPTRRRGRIQLLMMLRHPSAVVQSVRNYRRTSRRAVDGDEWAIRPMRAHEFRFAVHFATLAETVAEAVAAGLVVESAWSDSGDALDPTAGHVDADYVHYVCRRA